MRRKILLFLSMCIFLLSLTACSLGGGNNESTQESQGKEVNMAQAEVIQENWDSTKREEISDKPLKCILLANGTMVRFFQNKVIDENQYPQLVLFDIYDMVNEKVIMEQDISEYQIVAINFGCGVTENHFYLKSNKAGGLVVFSKEGSFHKIISIPEDVREVAISNDLSVMLYGKESEETGMLDLIQKNLLDETESVLYKTEFAAGKVTMFESFHFNQDDTKVGFKGITNPIDNEESIQCYGVIDLTTKEVWLEGKDEIMFQGRGDMMILSDMPRDIGEHGSGLVRFWNLTTGDYVDYHTEDIDESQFVYGVDENTFITELDGQNGTSIIRIYEKGEVSEEIEYPYEGETSYICELDYDKASKTLMLERYDMDALQYIVEMITVK